ncbi:hypothetical protein [Rhodococcus qingshengii]|uniref:hypothetical protein n=1 Tax=Rhodococcus qingshengii TaxID=334542 RepID=UPI001C24530F|nr:hypothetical protein [Rhodococcus qingshengii]QXC46154.1 hypothetical protein KSE96_30785 [Rhodococcus qingshengii]
MFGSDAHADTLALATLGLDDDSAILIRTNGHIAWRSDESDVPLTVGLAHSVGGAPTRQATTA